MTPLLGDVRTVGRPMSNEGGGLKPCLGVIKQVRFRPSRPSLKHTCRPHWSANQLMVALTLPPLPSLMSRFCFPFLGHIDTMLCWSIPWTSNLRLVQKLTYYYRRFISQYVAQYFKGARSESTCSRPTSTRCVEPKSIRVSVMGGFDEHAKWVFPGINDACIVRI